MIEVLFAEFSFGLALSLVVSGLIINVTLLVKIKYGDALVTHLTCLPYYISLTLLLTMFVEQLFYNIIGVIYNQEYTEALYDTFWLNAVLFVALIKYLLVISFILTRTFEAEALLTFVFFQRNLRLERLDVAKDTYKKLELRLARGFVAQYTFFMLPIFV